MTLLDWLRIEDGATGTKEGCAEGDCGACTVVLRRDKGGRVVHEPVNACILLAGQADGAEVVTVEDIGGGIGEQGAALHPVQEAMVRHHGSQCGFCTPGIVMSLYALYQDGARPVSRAAVCDQLAGNLCRCTGYRPIIDAALEACATKPPALNAAIAERLGAMTDETDIFAGDDQAFFAAPRSERVLAELLARFPDALLLSGATDAGLWITKSLMAPQRVIWLGRVRELDRIERNPDMLAVGATATLADAAHELGALVPDLGEIVRRFGSVQVRASATVGGNIANGSPIGDLAPCLSSGCGHRTRAWGRDALAATRTFLYCLQKAGSPSQRICAPHTNSDSRRQCRFPRLQDIQAHGRGHLGRAWRVRHHARRQARPIRAHGVRRHGRYARTCAADRATHGRHSSGQPGWLASSTRHPRGGIHAAHRPSRKCGLSLPCRAQSARESIDRVGRRTAGQNQDSRHRGVRPCRRMKCKVSRPVRRIP
jgi:aerobic-type carbon monoxide dehydrogenase small subunit (CoxS/CutS family)